MALPGPREPDRTMPEPATPPLSEPQRDFPVVLDVTGWRCLVVGGGRVAARRVAALLSAGARVTVVAPALAEALELLAGETEPSDPGPVLAVERRPYRPGEAAGYQLVETATGRPEVDGAVVGDAVRAGILVTCADRVTPGTMRLPAVRRSGPVTLAVSTAGTSPALARWLCDRLAACLPPELSTIAALGGRGPHRPAGGRAPDRRDGLDVTPGRACRTPGPGRPGRGGAGDPPVRPAGTRGVTDAGAERGHPR